MAVHADTTIVSTEMLLVCINMSIEDEHRAIMATSAVRTRT